MPNDIQHKLHMLRDQVIGAYQGGQTLRELGTIHGCSAGTVRNFLMVEGIARRSRGRTKQTVKVNNTIVSTDLKPPTLPPEIEVRTP